MFILKKGGDNYQLCAKSTASNQIKMLSLQNFTRNSSLGRGDLFASDIHVRNSVVTNAVD